MDALIVVDVQNDFLKGGALAVPEGNSIIPVINNLADKFEHIIYTQDWHPKDHKSFASSHPGRVIGEIISLGGLQQFLWPDHCVQNSFGAEFHNELALAAGHKVFRKGMNPEVDSYSAFYDNVRYNTTGLTDYLIMNAIGKVYICGLATDYCVKFSVLDALNDGFDTVLITDATKAVNVQPGDYEKALQEMKNAGAQLISSNQIL